MRFPPSFLDEIKTRLPVSEVARRKVKLVKAGREWKGLSPFNQEKTPSFYVNDQKQFFHDFSSGKHGNVFDFVMETEGLTFPEAVEQLAREAGLALPTASPEAEKREKRRATLHEAVEYAAQHFERELQGPKGARARVYLAERQISQDLQRRFRLGYAGSDRYGLREALASHGVDLETMIEAGLLTHGEEIASPYDQFRDRVMFPICDWAGRAIAFGGRAMDSNVPAKYLNSSETPLFHKGATLYNHHIARRAAQSSGSVVAVEGYIDVIAMAGAGFENVVASLGTAFTPEHCELLWTMSEEPILCFDGDKAGRRAAERAIGVALPLAAPGKTLQFAFLPEGQDPDDLVKSAGAAAMRDVLGAAKPLVEMLWAHESESSPLDTPERRAALERRLSARIEEIRDETLRKYYRDDLGMRLRALRFGGERQAGRARQTAAQPGRGATPWRRAPTPARGYVGSPPMIGASLARSATFVGRGTPPREASILVLLMNHPSLLLGFVEEAAALDFSTAELRLFRDALTGLASENPADAAAVRLSLEARGLDALRARIEAAAPISAGWCAKSDAEEGDAREMLRQALALHRRARALHRELQAAETALGRDVTDPNLDRLREIQSELSGLDGREAVLDSFGASKGREIEL